MTERPCWVTFTPANAADNAWLMLMATAGAPHRSRTGRRRSSLDDREQALDHLIGGRHDAGVGRIGLLRHDQLTELGRDVDVRGLERAADDLSCRRVNRLARFGRG